MSTTLALAIYFVIWWVTLFAILPLRFGEGAEEDEFTRASGAPPKPQLLIKFVLTTIVSAVIFAIVYAVIAYKLIRLDDIPFLKV